MDTPQYVLDNFSLELFGQQVSIWLDLGIVVGFGAVMIGIGVMLFRKSD